MKTTVEISDSLLREAKKAARREGVTLRTIIERGLRRIVAEAGQKTPFRLRHASFRGNGLTAEAEGGDWKRIRDLAYEGRGT